MQQHRSHECSNTEVMKTASPESKDIIDVFRARYVQEGIEQGIEQGLVKTARNMIEKGYSDEQISEVTNLTVKRIQSLRDSWSLKRLSARDRRGRIFPSARILPQYLKLVILN